MLVFHQMHSDFKDKGIYMQAKELYCLVSGMLAQSVPPTLRDQILRACISIILNFSEGYGRFSKNDKKHFYIIARGSLNEVIACFDLMTTHKNIGAETVEKFNSTTESLSKMLSGLINSQK